MVEKPISALKMLLGSEQLEIIKDNPAVGSEPFIKFIAIYLADQETLKKYKSNPDILLPLISQAEDMTPGEVAEIYGFFMSVYVNFSMSLNPVDQLAKIQGKLTTTKKK